MIIFISLNIIESFASQPSLYTLNILLPHLKMFNLDICIYQGPRDGDGNENVEKAIGLDQRNNALLYMSLPSLHDYDVNIPNFMLEDVNKGRWMFKLELGLPKKWTQIKYAYIWLFWWKGIKATKFEKTRTHFKSDVFAAVAAVACVQTSPLPQENRFFLREWRTSVHRLRR